MTPPLTLRMLFPIAVTRTPFPILFLIPLVLTHGPSYVIDRPTICVDPIIRGKNTPFELNKLLMIPTLLTSGFLTILRGPGHPLYVLPALVLTKAATFPINVRVTWVLIAFLCYDTLIASLPPPLLLRQPLVIATRCLAVLRLALFRPWPSTMLLTVLCVLPGTLLHSLSTVGPMTFTARLPRTVRHKKIEPTVL